ncbi:7977_t:CDS:2 [Entrophospora sp. SA101]|nr:12075_t:CDS:2 [Entrophospora sp. SA101]CAJ0886882.1 7977_t:CDS:2 [Entrophospora sp. SA101]
MSKLISSIITENSDDSIIKEQQNQSHLTCTESFYKDNIMEEIKSQGLVDEDQKNKMLNFLRKFEQENDETIKESIYQDQDLEDEEDIIERFKDINIDSADFQTIWNKLTEKERQEFLEGKIENFIVELELWKPWWQSLNFAKKPPNPGIIYNLVNILYAYAYTCRFFNGEILENLEESCLVIWDLSPILSSNQNLVYENASHAISMSLQLTLKNTKYKQPPDFSYLIINDIISLLSTHENTLAALSDLLNLFQKFNSSASSKQKSFLNGKKIEFYLSYTGYLLSIDKEKEKFDKVDEMTLRMKLLISELEIFKQTKILEHDNHQILQKDVEKVLEYKKIKGLLKRFK